MKLNRWQALFITIYSGEVVEIWTKFNVLGGTYLGVKYLIWIILFVALIRVIDHIQYVHYVH